MPEKHKILEDHSEFWESENIHIYPSTEEEFDAIEELEVEFWDQLGRDWFESLFPRNFAATFAKALSDGERQKYLKEKAELSDNMKMTLDDDTFESHLTRATEHIRENIVFRLYAVANQIYWEFHTIINQGKLFKRDIAALENNYKIHVYGNSTTQIKDGRGNQKIHDFEERVNQIIKAVSHLHMQNGFKPKEISQERVAEMLERQDGKHVERFSKWYQRNIRKRHGYTWSQFVKLVVEQVKSNQET